jgi:hypothetical protein
VGVVAGSTAIGGRAGPAAPVTDFAAWAAAARTLRPGGEQGRPGAAAE